MVVSKKQKEYVYWTDKAANDVIERERKFKRKIKVFRTESGVGASGFPHVGSFGDVTRAYSVALALKDAGVKSEYIAYSDDKDGLRKVPLTLPDSLEKYIGVPVSAIPDPFKCHNSYGEHMRSLMVDAIEKAGIEYTLESATENYKSGILDDAIETILLNAEKVGQIAKRLTGQEKYMEVLPYFAVCENCGKMYTTRSYKIMKVEHKILYVCDQEFRGKNLNNGKELVIKGCGHKDETSYFKGGGKLSWKPEFAARWKSLKILFEPIGKDIRDSVAINDAVCREVLNFEPPLHIMYEMFLDKSGKKISKSYGNVFTPQVWFRYGSIQSLVLLMLKRFEGTRELDVTDIPKYMDEMNNLERVYFGLEKVSNEKELNNMKRLFEYSYFLNPPKTPSVHAMYSSWLELAKILPEKEQTKFALQKLKEYGHVKKSSKEVERVVKERIEFAKNWVYDFEKTEIKLIIDAKEKELIKELIRLIQKENDGERLQEKIFELLKNHNLNIYKGFKLLYNIILSSDNGPRLGPYILERGKDEILEKLKATL